MPPELRFVELTDQAGRITEPGLVALAEPVHRQLRPGLPEHYSARIAEVCAAGAHLLAAVESDTVVGVALWRVIENTYEGRRLYVDDLVTDEVCRSRGVGRGLLQWLEQRARSLGCTVLALESGVQRARAHAFYFREGFAIPSFSLRKALL